LKLLPRLTPLSKLSPDSRSPLALKLGGAACAAVVLVLTGCSGDAPTPKDDSAFVYLLDRTSNWKEDAVSTLPPLPAASDVLSFQVSNLSPLNYGVDAKSLTVGEDGVVRFTAVITSPAGAHNVYYEGIRCDTYEWRLYAAANDSGTDWDRSVANNWQRIPNSELNAYQSALYVDYMCQSKMPTGIAKEIVQRIRYHRIASIDPAH